MSRTTKKSISTKGSQTKKKGTSSQSSPKNNTRSLRKQYLKSGSKCKVTFRLPKEAALDANVVTIVGDFNNWDHNGTRMRKLKSGDFTCTLELPCKREYRFKYLIDSTRWENDWNADKYIPNVFGTDDSVVVID
jgi:1,4-alpha-glucan branching enzyme